MTDQDPAHKRRQPEGITFHLTPETVWDAQKSGDAYIPEPFGAEGFVHCTDNQQLVIEVGNRYYRDDPRPYVLLDVDLDKVSAVAIYEDDACQYPHVYGPIESAAVVRVRRIERAPEGEFGVIGESIFGAQG